VGCYGDLCCTYRNDSEGVYVMTPTKAKARRKAGLKKLLKKFKTFKGKVNYVKKHIPDIKDPEAFVVSVVGKKK